MAQVNMSEPFRNCRKLHKLRGWGHRKTEQVFNRGSGTCHELRRAYEILRKALAFPIGGARPQTEEMTAFIDAHCGAVQVESICRVLLIAPSVYYEYKDREAYPSLLPAIAVRGTYLTGEIERARGRTVGCAEPGRSGGRSIGRTSESPAVR